MDLNEVFGLFQFAISKCASMRESKESVSELKHEHEHECESCNIYIGLRYID